MRECYASHHSGSSHFSDWDLDGDPFNSRFAGLSTTAGHNYESLGWNSLTLVSCLDENLINTIFMFLFILCA